MKISKSYIDKTLYLVDEIEDIMCIKSIDDAISKIIVKKYNKEINIHKQHIYLDVYNKLPNMTLYFSGGLHWLDIFDNEELDNLYDNIGDARTAAYNQIYKEYNRIKNHFKKLLTQ